MRGFSFALASTMSTLISYAFIICHSPQKSSVAQKVYKRALSVTPGHFLLDAESPIWRKRAGLATEGRRFWTSAPCQAAAGLDSGALPFPRHRALLVQWKPDRHASGSPFGGAGAERLRGQGRYQTALHCDSIALTKSLLIAAQRLFRAGLALSVTADAVPPLPRGEALAYQKAQKPPFGDCCSETSKLSDTVALLSR